jgi:hypothetical protein
MVAPRLWVRSTAKQSLTADGCNLVSRVHPMCAPQSVNAINHHRCGYAVVSGKSICIDLQGLADRAVHCR